MVGKAVIQALLGYAEITAHVAHRRRRRYLDQLLVWRAEAVNHLDYH
jgi:hypothetical protein